MDRCWANYPDPDNPKGPYLRCTEEPAGRYMNKYDHHKIVYACLDHSLDLTDAWIYAPELIEKGDRS